MHSCICTLRIYQLARGQNPKAPQGCTWQQKVYLMLGNLPSRWKWWRYRYFKVQFVGCTCWMHWGGNPWEEIPPLHEYSTPIIPGWGIFQGFPAQASWLDSRAASRSLFKHGGQHKSHVLKLMWNPAKYLQICLTYILWKWFKLLRKIYRFDRDGKIRTTVRGAVIWGKLRFS